MSAAKPFWVRFVAAALLLISAWLFTLELLSHVWGRGDYRITLLAVGGLTVAVVAAAIWAARPTLRYVAARPSAFDSAEESDG